MKSPLTLGLSLVLSLSLLAGCASTSLTEDKPSVQDSSSQGQSAQVNADAARIQAARAELDRVKNAIYFGYDRFEVADSYKDVILAYSKYLSIDTKARLVLEGNTDERGTSEYNLALGSKRAEAVQARLRALGVPDARMESISFGEERPRAKGSDEAAYAENRRVDLILK